MKIHVQLWAQLRDLANTSALELELPNDSTISDLLEHLYSVRPSLRGQDANVLCGIGVEFVDRHYRLSDGDEVAVMPPVQGG